MTTSSQNIRIEQLAGATWQGVACPTGLTEAWRQIHYAAQVASEVGKSWGQPRDDDSHSNLGWFADGDQAGFEGVASDTEPAFRARLDLGQLTLAIVARDGAIHDRFHCHGQRLSDAMAWVDRVATQLGGPRRQPSVPAPDLPEHSVATGAAFDTSDSASFHAVSDWYANADALLQTLADLMPSTESPRCWPHHLDHATLSILRRDAQGVMTASVGVGITPPDSMDQAGYWYVGPWESDPSGSSGTWPELPAGRWVERKEAMPLGILPLIEVEAHESATAQQTAVASFVAVAVNACRANLL